MAWIYLILAGAFEVVWAIELKYTEGFSKLYPSLITVFAMLLSFTFLAQSLKELPIGTAYAIWTGIGAVGTVLYGIYFLGESTNFTRIFCIALIVIAIIGLKFTSRS
ncbi:multidrug efflux system protein [Legionella lansingensis]|uniref:Guanidinium exporter n=1 Tax=Legionella lansingensis TaxID=45067 RepID=A0A0W0VPM2_9GAMM|nr:quaternary ammonium compound efflux SMR transporter SugE [Legionella lansingensis]KTD22071.1 multidrug efflux system protein [Legionella lansingensis]SNV54269.1 multidrug efflux system protein [Legionella lansingensis]